MRNQVKWALLTAGLIMVGAGMAQAAGFNIYEAGVRATALGGAFTATADDGSAIFYNAAGLSFQDGSSLNVALMPVMPSFSFKGATTPLGEGTLEESADNTFPIPAFYYTHSKADSKVSFGLGLYAPFGLGVEWLNPEEYVGRTVSYDVEIKTIYVTPAISYKVADDVAFAVGIDIAKQHINLNKITRDPYWGQNALDTEIDGWSDLNFTPSLGLMYRPEGKFSLGVMYHHKKTMKYKDGEATLDNMLGEGDPAYTWTSTLLAGIGGSDHKLDSELNLPYILSMGAAYQFSPKLKGEVNLVRFGWGTFQELALDFTTSDALDQTITFNYEDTWQVRAGLDFAAIPGKLNLMAGYVYDETPQPLAAVSPLLPDASRNDYSFGVSYKTGAWDLSACYMAVIGEERTNIENGQPANHDPAYPVGTYKSVANIFGAGIGYRF